MRHSLKLWPITAFIVASMLFSIQCADAVDQQPPPAPPPTGPGDPPFDCKHSPITPQNFLDMFHMIAMHGDLRDAPFIEQAMHVHFAYSNPINGNKHYMSYGVLFPNAPINVSLRARDDQEETYKRSSTLAQMHFSG